ncbi:MAG TPA: CAP domain-containing protein [Actinoplanes sp.]|nr:CAP domain-containing protein [Actinoplanes sp.]
MTDDRNLTPGSRPPARHRDQRSLPAPVVLGLTVAALLGALGVAAALAPGSLTGPGAPAEAPAALTTRTAGDTAADGGTGGAGQVATQPSPPRPADAVATPRTAGRQAAPSTFTAAKPTKAPARRPAAPAPAANPKIGSGQQAQENEVIRLTNVERAKRGCGKVTLDTRLRTAIRGHTQDMANQDYFAHESLDGRSPWDRAKAAGYQYPIGENIAKGQPSAADVMHSWMNSPGHKANILNCNAKAIGVGLSYDGGVAVWGQLFGSR